MSGVVDYVEVKLCDPYVVDDFGRSAFIYAIWGKQVEIARYLKRVAPGIHLLMTSNKTSSLQIAVFSRMPELVEEILAPLPESFDDARFIAQKTIELLYAENVFLRPEELAKQLPEPTILQMIQKFQSECSIYEQNDSSGFDSLEGDSEESTDMSLNLPSSSSTSTPTHSGSSSNLSTPTSAEMENHKIILPKQLASTQLNPNSSTNRQRSKSTSHTTDRRDRLRQLFLSSDVHASTRLKESDVEKLAFRRRFESWEPGKDGKNNRM